MRIIAYLGLFYLFIYFHIAIVVSNTPRDVTLTLLRYKLFFFGTPRIYRVCVREKSGWFIKRREPYVIGKGNLVNKHIYYRRAAIWTVNPDYSDPDGPIRGVFISW